MFESRLSTESALRGAALTESPPFNVVAILTCHNRVNLSTSCLVSLATSFNRATIDFPGMKLSVVAVDDGSTDGTSNALIGVWPEATIVQANGSLYWAGGMALAERIAIRDHPSLTHLLWLNDDTLLLPDSVCNLLKLSVQLPDSIIVGSIADYDSGEVIYSGIRCSRWHPGHNRKVSPNGAPQKVDTMNGNAVLVPVSVVAALGGIDGQYGHAAADFDYGRRASALGYETWLIGEVCGLGKRDQPKRPASILGRWRDLTSIKGAPPGKNLRYVKRHAGVLWPIFAVSPYMMFVIKELRFALDDLCHRARRRLTK